MLKKKVLFFDLEHGSQSLGSKEYIEKMFGYPELEPATFKEFQNIIQQLYSKKSIEQDVKVGNITVKQSLKKVVANKGNEIDVVVIDTVSELSKKYVRSLMGNQNQYCL